MKSKYFLLVIIIVSVGLFVFVYPQGTNRGIDWVNNGIGLSLPHAGDYPFHLGLDLLGGAHLLYEADLSQILDFERADAMDGIRDVIERRVNFFGVAEPNVQVSGSDRLIVELAGISDVNQAIQLIGETPFLEFKEESSDVLNIIEAQQKGERLNEEIYISTGLNGKHIQKAQVAFDNTTAVPQVSLSLNEEGTKLFAEITKRNVGKTVAIYLDGIPISNPVVNDEIIGGKAIITGRFTPEEAKLLATRLNSGALPVPIHLISQQTVGASLGAQSIAQSLKAGIYGLMLVALFMIVFYRLPGLISVVALAIYVVIVLAIYKLLPVTLTLAGIAGFILSLGMAVDANILIFARMREELKSGKSINQSIKEGFSRAWLSIRDSHITTLIGAFILYVLTTSIIKGFALTLSIGVLISLFTAISVSRVFLLMFARPKFDDKKWLFR